MSIKTDEERFREREERIIDAILLKMPDRVPIAPFTGFFPAKYVGMTCEQVMYDYEGAYNSWKKTALDFEWDMILDPHYAYSGPTFDLLDFKQLKWPGRGVNPNHTYQFIEGEYMKANEYDDFIEDPTDWMMRAYFPQIFGILAPLKKIPPLREVISYYLGLSSSLKVLGSPEVSTALEALIEAARESYRWSTSIGLYRDEMNALGYPFLVSGQTHVPFDTIGDFFRGTRGIMIDMFRHPEKLLEAIRKITPIMLNMGLSASKKSKFPRIFIPLHKGAREFISVEQFETFYWPSLKKIMLGLIDEGLVPYLLLEGDFTDRLEIIRDVPKGKAIYHFENTDIIKAKEVLGDRVCIKGNVPISLLCIGTINEVKEYCKNLIDVVGEEGGFIMDAGAVIDEAKPENMMAMTTFTKKYGKYKK
jgi:uroporphyrinogen-III decarboxylase